MAKRPLALLGLLPLAIIPILSCATGDPLNRIFGPDGRTMREAIATFPEEKQKGFELMQVRCTKCHTLNVPFSAHLPRGAWRAQVRVMSKRPGAGIPPGDLKPIADFLEHFSEVRRQAAP